MMAAANSQTFSGEANTVTSERAQTSSRKDTDTSWEQRKKRFQRMAAPKKMASAFGSCAPLPATYKVRKPQITTSISAHWKVSITREASRRSSSR
jgi:hypothetical protein